MEPPSGVPHTVRRALHLPQCVRVCMDSQSGLRSRLDEAANAEVVRWTCLIGSFPYWPS